MIANEVINLAQQAGAKIFTRDGNVVSVVIADRNVSGNGTDFIHRFAQLIIEHNDIISAF